MADNSESSSSSGTPEAPAAATTWKLPDGIEDHVASGLVKTAVGVTVGGVLGVIMFRGGKGMRAASIAAGVGAAAGSSYERYVAANPATTTSS